MVVVTPAAATVVDVVDVVVDVEVVVVVVFVVFEVDELQPAVTSAPTDSAANALPQLPIGVMLTAGRGAAPVPQLAQDPADVEKVVTAFVDRVPRHPGDAELLPVPEAAANPFVAGHGFHSSCEAFGGGRQLSGDRLSVLLVVGPFGHHVVPAHGRELGSVLGERLADSPVVQSERVAHVARVLERRPRLRRWPLANEAVEVLAGQAPQQRRTVPPTEAADRLGDGVERSGVEVEAALVTGPAWARRIPAVVEGHASV